ncbi:hypothetical protein KQH29_00860 [bacterium]|nr:hypothetical protein [bacterium]
MKKTADVAGRRFKFNKADLLAVKVPDGKPYVEVQDSEVKALRCRVSAGGKMTMFMDKKVEGRHVKRTLGEYIPGPGGSRIDDFRSQARGELVEINKDAVQWLEGEQPVDAEKITLQKAFELTLAASKRGPMARRDWEHATEKFLGWMKDNYPMISTWARLRRLHVKEYLAAQQPTKKSIERGIDELSPTRKRLLMQPLSQTARHMWHEHELPNVAERLGVSAKLKKTPSPVYLADVLAFLDHLKGVRPASLEAGAALAGLGGLQLLEVLRLTWSKVDLKKGLVEISGDVKNEYRNRVIPIPARCIDALRRAHAARPSETVQAVDGGAVVTSPAGRPFHGGSWLNYSKLIKAEIRAWNSSIDWAPKDLRNCLPTLAALRGFAGDAVEQYLGHAPRSVTARNYIPRLSPASIGEAAELERATENFKRLVVEHVEREIQVEIERAKKNKIGVQGVEAV